MKKRENYKGKTVIGLAERIIVYGNTTKVVKARIDTGATKSSIDKKLVKELGLGPIVETKLIKSAQGCAFRPIIRTRIRLANKEMVSKFSIADRKHMTYRVLIGQNILRRHFLVDPSIKFLKRSKKI